MDPCPCVVQGSPVVLWRHCRVFLRKQTANGARATDVNVVSIRNIVKSHDTRSPALYTLSRVVTMDSTDWQERLLELAAPTDK